MYEFGEEFVIGSYKVPWLIWIQLVVMILLVMLLFYGLTIFSLDLDLDATPTSNNSTQVNTHHASSSPPVAEAQNVKDSRLEITPEQIPATEGPSTKDVRFRPLRPEHPCHYLGLAKQAFLKCLGLDSGSESSGDRSEHMKID